MFLVWAKDILHVTSFKCSELPLDGHGKPRPFISKHVLSEEEEKLSLKELEVLYPAPSVE